LSARLGYQEKGYAEVSEERFQKKLFGGRRQDSRGGDPHVNRGGGGVESKCLLLWGKFNLGGAAVGRTRKVKARSKKAPRTGKAIAK